MLGDAQQPAQIQVAQAFNELYDLKLTTRGVMEYAYRGETLTPSQCGRMDQACAFGRNPVSMTYDGSLLDMEQLELAAPMHIVIVDLNADKDTATILRGLRAAYEFSDSQRPVWSSSCAPRDHHWSTS